MTVTIRARRAPDAVEACRLSLPLDDPLRHALDPLDAACARLAPGWTDPLAAPLEDVAQLALDMVDVIFHRNHPIEADWTAADMVAFDGWTSAVLARCELRRTDR